jgi:tRNA (adenine37-N6)-methyltransferase
VGDDVFSIRPIARVHSTRTEAIDDGWDGVEASITLLDPYGPQAIAGLEAFSHLEVVFVFDRVDPDVVPAQSRHPRGNQAWPEVGIFTQRAKDRPNRLGLSVCQILAVEATTIRVRGLDAIDGTPVVDLKPYIAEFGARGPLRQPAWADELMVTYF